MCVHEIVLGVTDMSSMNSNSDSVRDLTSSTNPNEADPILEKPLGSKNIGWEY